MIKFRLARARRNARAAWYAATLLTGGNAFAQTYEDPIGLVVTSDDVWKYSLGLGVASHPRYPGSDQTRTSIVPVGSVEYGRYFLGGVPGAGAPVGLGAYLVRDSHWTVGLGLGAGIRKARKESDSPRLHGLGDIDSTVTGTVFGSYRDEWLSLHGSVGTDLGGQDQGTRVGLGLEGRYSPIERLTLTAGPGVNWADRKYTRKFFGIDAAQSASSGRARYDASSGIESIEFNVGANYQLTRQWGVGARAGFGRLRGDAANSPITEDKSQNKLAVFVNYRF